MLIRLGYEIAISCAQPTPVISLLEIHIRAPAERKAADPCNNIALRADADLQGCLRQYVPAVYSTGRWHPDTLRRCSRGQRSLDEVNTLAHETPIENLPDDTLGYLLGSRYCETDHLGGMAWDLFGHLPPGWARVQAIVDYVHARMSFGYGYARSTRTAAQAHEERVGVCRDFAHLAITLCRSMNIPARYVNGYLGDIGVPADPAPMDFSAWMEVVSRRQMVHIRP